MTQKMNGNLNKGSEEGQGFRLLKMIEYETRKKSLEEDLKTK